MIYLSFLLYNNIYYLARACLSSENPAEYENMTFHQNIEKHRPFAKPAIRKNLRKKFRKKKNQILYFFFVDPVTILRQSVQLPIFWLHRSRDDGQTDRKTDGPILIY